MQRISRDQLGLKIAIGLACRGTCIRKQVGCALFDHDGHIVGSGYNGPAAGEPHCIEHPCPGSAFDRGAGLDVCEAIHAEQNALLQCPDVRRIHTCFVTASPCLHCTKLLLNTGCQRIVFMSKFASDHDAAQVLWTRNGVRRWEMIADLVDI